MAWIRIDDQMVDHPKIGDLSDAAFRWIHRGLSYANRYLTNGVLPQPFLDGCPAEVRAELLAAGVWETRRGKTVIHDYADYQPSKEVVTQRRAGGRRRQSLFRDRVLRDQIRERDEDLCRYCGHLVAWTDRRGPGGGTYDHLNPHGDNSLENVVIACRGCNSKKGCRTPEQANMRLLPSGTSSGPKSDSSHGLGVSVTPTRPDPEEQIHTKNTYGGADAPRFPQAVEKTGASDWKRAIAIAHAVIEADEQKPENWRSEVKFRLGEQGVDPNQRSPRGAKLFDDALDYAVDQRRKRAAS